MIATALAFARRIPVKAWATVGVLALFLAFGAYCSQRAAQGVRDREAVKAAKVEARAATGREAASGERAIDTANLNSREKELTDAVQSLPDARPSARRIALACGRLRQQGVREADLPADCRPAD